MPKKFLILRFSSIGDIVLTTPVMRCLKKRFPDAEIHYATKKNFEGLLQHNPYVDKVFCLENGLLSLINHLQSERYDEVIDLHNNLRTGLIKTALRLYGTPSSSFDKLNFEKWILVRFKQNLLPNTHIVDRYMATVSHLGVQNDDRGLDYFIPYADEVEIQWLPPSHQQGFVAVAIGGQHATKKLPAQKLVELCQKIKQPIVLLGGREDIAVANDIEKNTTNALIYNACGKFNLNQSASIIKQSLMVYTHDTGLMHIAAAFKKRIVSIWGNTVPEFGMYPYQTDFVAWQVEGLPCRPCSKIGFGQCPAGHFRCMNEQKIAI